MSDYFSTHSDRSDSWFDRLAAKLGFANSIDARTVIEEALADDEGEAFTATERTMLQKVLRLKDVRVEDLCIPRGNVVAVEDTATVEELMGTIARTGYSRLPVYRNRLDNPVGMVHVRDVTSWLSARVQSVASANGAAGIGAADLATSVTEAGLIREVMFAPPSMPALDLLARMQKRHIQLALVIDEYGGTDGLVTMEDLMEAIVGDILDEHDASVPLIAEDPSGLVADARAGIEDVEAKIGRQLVAEGEDEVDTLGGLVFTMLGRIPARGEIIPHPAGFEFEILDADRRRVKKLKLRLPEATRTHAA